MIQAGGSLAPLGAVSLKQVTVWQGQGRLEADRISLFVQPGERVLIWGGRDVDELFIGISGLRPLQEGQTAFGGALGIIGSDFPVMEGILVREYLTLPLVIHGLSGEDAWQRIKPMIHGGPLWRCKNTQAKAVEPLYQCLVMFYMAAAVKPEIFLMGNCLKSLKYEEREAFWHTVEPELGNRTLLCFGDRPDIGLKFDRSFRLDDGRLAAENSLQIGDKYNDG